MNTADENINASDDKPAGDPSAPAAGSSSVPPSAGADPAPSEPAAAAVKDPLLAERDQLKEQLLRTAADFDNFRKRTRREIEEARMRGKDDAIKEILPVFDNLERAVAASGGAQSVASVVEGVKMVLKLFQDTAERLGLNRVPTVGQRFDPAMHEAIQQKETDEAPPGTILTEVMPGYMFGQRLLRAAMVVVARKPAPPKVEAPAAPAADGGSDDAVSSSSPAANGGNASDEGNGESSA